MTLKCYIKNFKKPVIRIKKRYFQFFQIFFGTSPAGPRLCGTTFLFFCKRKKYLLSLEIQNFHFSILIRKKID